MCAEFCCRSLGGARKDAGKICGSACITFLPLRLPTSANLELISFLNTRVTGAILDWINPRSKMPFSSLVNYFRNLQFAGRLKMDRWDPVFEHQQSSPVDIVSAGHRNYVNLIYDRKSCDYYCKILHCCKHSCRAPLYYSGPCSLSLINHVQWTKTVVSYVTRVISGSRVILITLVCNESLKSSRWHLFI